MKNTVYILLAAILITSSCENVDELLTFKLTQKGEVEVPAFPNIIDTNFTITTPEIPVTLQQEAESNGSAKDKVKDIILDEVRIYSKDPDSTDLGFLKTLSLYIVSDGLPEQLIATKTEIPTGIGSEMLMEVTGNPIDEYIKQDNIKFRLDMGADDALQQTTTIATDLIMSITADPLK